MRNEPICRQLKKSARRRSHLALVRVLASQLAVVEASALNLTLAQRLAPRDSQWAVVVQEGAALRVGRCTWATIVVA